MVAGRRSEQIWYPNRMSKFTAEFIGTAFLIIMGDGVVANVLLNRSKGQNSGWIVISVGWGIGVALAVYCVGAISGGHLNPAVTLGLATIGQFAWADVPGYIAAQMAGAFVGATFVWLAYLPHWKGTTDQGAKLAVFCTAPAIRSPGANLLTEAIGTFILMLGVLAILSPSNLKPAHGFDTGLGPLLVGVLVLGIGVSLGGPTGYAINPARDFASRIAHWALPIDGKGGSDWGYACVPVIGPFIGGVLGALFYRMMWLP
jgi:glycerol uptake facilitator protein